VAASAWSGPWERGVPQAQEQLLGLVRASLLATWNSWWRSGPGRRLAATLAVPVVVALWAATVPPAESLLGRLSPGQMEAPLATLAALLWLFTLASSVSFALASVYFARDVEWLLSSPLSATVFLAHRLASQLAIGLTVGVLVGGPAVLAAVIRFHAPLLVPLVALTLPALLLVPMSLALLGVVLVVRLVPAPRVRDAAAILVAGVGFGAAAVDLAATFSGHGSGGLGLNRFDHGVAAAAWLPTSWVARSLVAVASGHLTSAIPPAASTALLAAVVTPLGVLIASRFLREGWYRSQFTATRTRRSRLAPALPAPLAILRKDGRILRRDPGQLIQLLLPVGLFAVYLLSPRGGSGVFRDFPPWYGPLTTASFAALFAASGLGLRAIGAEGKHAWCLFTAPLRPRTVLLSKAQLPALVATGASLALLLVTEATQRLPGNEVAISAVQLTMLVMGLVGLAVGMGAAWPRLDWNDPRRAVGIWLVMAFMLLGATYLAVSIVAFTLPLLLTWMPFWEREALSLVICGLCAATAGGAALRAGIRRLSVLDL
jgi:ABC-2 type transport system permease protein